MIYLTIFYSTLAIFTLNSYNYRMKIVKLGDERLRMRSSPLDIKEINADFLTLIDEMFSTMIKSNGVGLAAIQVGIPKRFFIAIADDDVKRVFINPVIVATSPSTVLYEEGCLSIPGVNESVRRPAKVTVQAYNEKGRRFTLEATGLLARIILHEYDHLDGIVFLDKLEKEKGKKIEERFIKKEQKRQSKHFSLSLRRG